MNTNRLTINNIDLSTALTEETSAVTGYTVVRSKGGSSKPVKFTGNSKVANFKAIFGEGGKSEPDVYEALTFLNAGYDLYVAAPYKTATVPIAAVTDKGIFMLSDNINYGNVEDFATGGLFSSVELNSGTSYMVEVSKLRDYFDGVTVERLGTDGFTVKGAPSGSDPNKSLFDMFFNTTVSLKLVKEDGTTQVFDGAYTSSTGAVTYTLSGVSQEVFDSSILYALSGTSVKDDQDAEVKELNIKGYLFPKFPTTTNTNVSFVPPKQADSITIADINNSNIGFSLASVDNSQPYICYAEIDSTVDTSGIKSLASLSFRGSTKDYGDEHESVVEKGWELALDVDDNIDLFFDPICHNVTDSAPTGSFFGLASRSKYMGLAGYLFNCTVDPNKVSDAPTLDYGPNYWSICNQAVIYPASAKSFYSSMIGARAVMQARIIEKNYGGSAPMYINDSNGLGGQLSSLVGSTKLRYSFKPDIRQKLADKNYNVIISDPNYGVLITSQMTCKSGTLTDWSYIGHACAFLTLEKLIWDNVMIPQIGKANNPYYRDLRAQQVQRYLDARTGGSNSIWSAATVDTSTAPGVNDVAARKAMKFVIVVKVKVNIFSEEVVLNFVNLPQDATL